MTAVVERPSPDPGAVHGADATVAAPRVVRREIQEFLRTHEQRRRQLPRAVIVGLAVGMTAVAFRAALDWEEPLRMRALEAAHAFGFLGLLVVLSATTGAAAFAVWLVKRFSPEASGSGIPHVKAVVRNLRPMPWARILGVKFVGGAVAIGAGLALGREGPTIQMGAAIGEMVRGWFDTTPRERRTLIAAGAGAGLSAAFNAPLAGLVFVLEELQGDFAPAVFATALVASVVADLTTRLLLGQLPVFHVSGTTIPPLGALPLSLVLGVLAALLGVAFNRGLLASLDAFQQIARRRPWYAGAVAGAIVGMLGWFAPAALGSGNRLVEATLHGAITLPWLALFFVIRFGLTMVSYGCGAAGGIFAPLLVLGAQIGLAVAIVAQRWFPAIAIDAPTFAVVGMAA
ncbi:MAG TPA: H(+)/Cl(-) exchange transporter ClcA, partial [Candidatus Binatia bacterium]|nr:H(+)/Cl(-) exchange transporter ClcA [Candidatus Binatia bacterium]